MFTLNRRTVATAAAAIALAAGSASWAATSASAATGHPAAASAVIPRCSAADLAVWVNANSGSGAAGTIWYHLDYTNVSRSTCHLYSYPGVSAVNAAGKQLGPAAKRVGVVPATYVNIPAGGTAHSLLGYVDVQVTKACKPANATHLRVYPPDDTSAKDAFFPVSVCTTNTPDLVIERVQPGV